MLFNKNNGTNNVLYQDYINVLNYIENYAELDNGYFEEWDFNTFLRFDNELLEQVEKFNQELEGIDETEYTTDLIKKYKLIEEYVDWCDRCILFHGDSEEFLEWILNEWSELSELRNYIEYIDIGILDELIARYYDHHYNEWDLTDNVYFDSDNKEYMVVCGY